MSLQSSNPFNQYEFLSPEIKHALWDVGMLDEATYITLFEDNQLSQSVSVPDSNFLPAAQSQLRILYKTLVRKLRPLGKLGPQVQQVDNITKGNVIAEVGNDVEGDVNMEAKIVNKH